jgi:TPR repeat protein
MIKTTITVILTTIAYLPALPLEAADVTDCDRLAAHQSDPDKVVAAGVSGADVSAAAIGACRQAVATEPDNLRFRYQLARALAENGRAAEGHPDMHRAAEGGYRQAQFVLGYLYDEGMQGLIQDRCAAAALWRGAARQGLMAALLSFPHHVLRGRFDTCGITADNNELRSMLQQAQSMEPDYYQRMIIRDLLAELVP